MLVNGQQNLEPLSKIFGTARISTILASKGPITFATFRQQHSRKQTSNTMIHSTMSAALLVALLWFSVPSGTVVARRKLVFRIFLFGDTVDFRRRCTSLLTLVLLLLETQPWMPGIYFNSLLERLQGDEGLPHLQEDAIPIDEGLQHVSQPRRVNSGSPWLPVKNNSLPFLPNASEHNNGNPLNQGRIQQLRRVVQCKKLQRRQRPYRRQNVLHPDIGVAKVKPSNKKLPV